MLSSFRFHHIGYVTDSIANTSAPYVRAGYQATPVIDDEIQRVKICFLTKDGMPRVELIEPIDEQSSVNKILKKNGVAPYHVCYEVDDINATVDELVDVQGYIPLFRPVEAIALDNKLICYLYKKEVGFIELVNKD
ncbi:VOC family protein [Mucilaginibacter corticis]|uniref:VOC family protein n=1 Tax=Mucilaginibacter corticis TaxID=2597670 RepID=A0A556MUZ1_9SPHI|nr:VOC family protein [Mucilaginibacter corticis]TSJ43683.1 VOC family protein [Mucilaginibacter corticis]